MQLTLRGVKRVASITPAIPLATSYRITSIDLLRGLVMILMALDHTRDFFHVAGFTGDPLDFATTTPALFLTRWITHFCAPVFVFLAGTSAFLQSGRKPKRELSGLLIKRGLWLLVVEIILINFAFTFDIHLSVVGLQTIWAIGISMMVLGLVIWLPFRAILALGTAIVLGHNLLDFYEASHSGGFGIMYSLLHRPGFFPISDGHFVDILYPFLPWTGLMMLGYCFGTIYKRYNGATRVKVLARLGSGIILFFIALRATNLYGDPSHWAVQKNGLYTVFSFINATKYPPSLLYMCMTIGPALLFLAAMEGVRNSLTKVITVYGQVPFFYYVLHFYLIHTVSALLFLGRGHSFTEGVAGAPNFPFKFVMPGEGYSLWVVYVIWLAIVVALYPLCKWFSDYKRTHRKWWLSYL